MVKLKVKTSLGVGITFQQNLFQIDFLDSNIGKCFQLIQTTKLLIDIQIPNVAP